MPDFSEAYDDGLIRQIFRTTRAFSRTLNGEVAAGDLHSSEWMVLNLIYRHDGLSQAELIQFLAVEPAAITRTLARLEKKSLLARTQVESGRGKFIRLTDAGRSAFEQLAPAVKRHRERALTGLSSAEREQLMNLMGKVYDNLR